MRQKTRTRSASGANKISWLHVLLTKNMTLTSSLRRDLLCIGCFPNRGGHGRALGRPQTSTEQIAPICPKMQEKREFIACTACSLWLSRSPLWHRAKDSAGAQSTQATVHSRGRRTKETRGLGAGVAFASHWW